MKKIDKILPDSSVIIEGFLSKKLESKEIDIGEILIHEAVIAELEHQANENKTIGLLGIEEIDRLQNMSGKIGFSIRFCGRRPNINEIRNSDKGAIDALIRESAYEEGVVLMTADKVQGKVAKAKGMDCFIVEIEDKGKKLRLEEYFDNTTMSVHLRENIKAKAKKGKPGEWEFSEVSKKELKREDIQDISREIIEEAKIRRDGFIEIERAGSTIVQLGNFRIVITKPPFSDGWEITAVRPVKRLDLEYYNLSEKLRERLEKQAEGILIAGAPGHGKSTCAQALAEFYSKKKKIVKTVEAPRDLVLGEEITQYAISHGSAQEIHDVLLLSRPDYTIFDEMRNTEDFRLFSDLRLSGVGMMGVVHATKAVDAIQRFVGRIELGIIPQVIDTVLFIQNGEIHKILSLQMVVKVPAGMTEADLARPIVVVQDFESGKAEYELYSYGEETVVVPVSGNKGREKKGLANLAQKQIKEEFMKFAKEVIVEVVDENNCIVAVPEDKISKIIGQKGQHISSIEDKLGIHINVLSLDEFREKYGDENNDGLSEQKGKQIEYNFKVAKNNVKIFVDETFLGKDAAIFINSDFLLNVKVGKSGVIKISKKNKIGKVLIDSLNMKEDVKLCISDDE